MRLSKQQESNLARFGCVYLPKQNLICIRWPHELETAASANIIVGLVSSEGASGPLLSLAFEISRNRALAQYCFFPFDLRRATDAKFLSTVFQKRKIELCFLGESGQIKRVKELSPTQRTKMAQLYTAACADSADFPDEAYNFDRAVIEFEQGARLVDYFQYVLTESELQRAITVSKEAAAKVAPQEKTQAARITNELLDILRPRYEHFAREFIDNIPLIRRNLLFLSDLRKHFEADYDGFSQFVADAIAANSAKEDKQNLQALVPVLQLMLKLIDHLRNTPMGGQSLASWEAELRDTLSRISAQGFSFQMLKSIASIVGFQGGRPGRPSKDYSAEYELRARRRKWREVAEHNLKNDPDTQQEFGIQNFADLTPDKKRILEHRVKERLRGFAKRTGKPFPPEQQKSN